jgi:hypothetical protein
VRRPTAEPIDLGERKERVLHTRVPESLDRYLKRRARNLGMSVSTVVRNVLINTFGLVEDIVTDSTNVALSISGQEGIAARDQTARGGVWPPDDAAMTAGILGWQEVFLNLNAVCDRCNAVLRKGARAAIGVRERPGPRAIICGRCLAKTRREG